MREQVLRVDLSAVHTAALDAPEPTSAHIPNPNPHHNHLGSTTTTTTATTTTTRGHHHSSRSPSPPLLRRTSLDDSQGGLGLSHSATPFPFRLDVQLSAPAPPPPPAYYLPPSSAPTATNKQLSASSAAAIAGASSSPFFSSPASALSTSTTAAVVASPEGTYASHIHYCDWILFLPSLYLIYTHAFMYAQVPPSARPPVAAAAATDPAGCSRRWAAPAATSVGRARITISCSNSRSISRSRRGWMALWR